MTNKKVYVVELSPGEYKTFEQWPQCQRFVHGKPYPFAGGASVEEAKAKIRHAKAKRAHPAPRAKALKTPVMRKGLPTAGITSDAGTRGNPGPSEFQITDLEGNRLAYQSLGVHSNNFAELAGIKAMIEYAIEHGETQLWTDSQIAIGWIQTGRIGEQVHERDKILAMVKQIRLLRVRHPKIQLRKWETKRWGQIPSDFGRK